MLTNYLNQTCVLRRKTGISDRGQPVYADPVTVPCRKQQKTQNILKEDGQSIKSQTVYYLAAEVNTGDSIDGRPILIVETMPDLCGVNVGYKAAV